MLRRVGHMGVRCLRLGIRKYANQSADHYAERNSIDSHGFGSVFLGEVSLIKTGTIRCLPADATCRSYFPAGMWLKSARTRKSVSLPCRRACAESVQTMLRLDF